MRKSVSGHALVYSLFFTGSVGVTYLLSRLWEQPEEEKIRYLEERKRQNHPSSSDQARERNLQQFLNNLKNQKIDSTTDQELNSLLKSGKEEMKRYPQPPPTLDTAATTTATTASPSSATATATEWARVNDAPSSTTINETTLRKK